MVTAMQDVKHGMTIEQFIEFYDEQPDGKWELIEGVPTLAPTPTDYHQMIVGNLQVALTRIRDDQQVAWIPLPGVGTRVPVSPRSLPQPDLMVKAEPGTGSHTSHEAIVLFEVLSLSNRKADRDWRHRVYSSVPNCQHYVTISQSKPIVIRHDRANDWKATEFKTLDAVLYLPALEARISLNAIYRDTPVARKAS